MLGALVFAAIGAVRADADVGNFNDYGDGGGGDYGGGDYGGYDYGDGYDSGDGDFAFLFGWLFSSSVGPYAAIPIVLLIVFLVIRSNMKHGRRGHRGPSAHVPPPAVYTVYTDNSGAVEAEVRAAGDEAFSMADFLSAAETVFVKLQYAWTARDWESIRPFESNRLFNKHKTQLEEYIRLGRTDVMERISVNRSYAVSRVATGEEERIAVYLEAAFNNYIIETEEGKLTVTSPEQHIVITANSAEKTYDGTPLTDDGFTYTDFVLAEGDVLEAVVEGSQTDAGSSVNVIKSYRVMRGDEDVTANYIFDDSVDGTLTVTKRKVTLTSGTACKIYDGKYLTCNKVEVGGDGFVEGEGATYDVTGKRKDIGWSYNDFTYKLNDNTKADNYEITVERGFLYVKDQAEKPKTGDSSDLLLLLALMSMSGAGAAGTVYLYRRKREEQE